MSEKPTVERAWQKKWQSLGHGCQEEWKASFKMNFPLVFSLGRRNQSLPTESFQFVSSTANCVYLSPGSRACLLSLAFSKVSCLLGTNCCDCQRCSPHLGAGWLTTQSGCWEASSVSPRGGTQSLEPKSTPGEKERGYTSWLWEEPRRLPCVYLLGPSVLRTKQKASEYYQLIQRALLVPVEEIETPFFLLIQTSRWLTCLSLGSRTFAWFWNLCLFSFPLPQAVPLQKPHTCWRTTQLLVNLVAHGNTKRWDLLRHLSGRV